MTCSDEKPPVILTSLLKLTRGCSDGGLYLYLSLPVCVQVRELQTELLMEQKKSEEYQKGVRRYEKRVKELTYQV